MHQPSMASIIYINSNRKSGQIKQECQGMTHSSEDTNTGKFNYGAMLFITILIIIILITFFSFLCTRMQLDARLRSLRFTTTSTNTDSNTGDPFSTMINMGLDDATLNSYQKHLYSQAQPQKVCGPKGGNCCSICLVEYKGKDIVRILPDWGHWFHQKCVDAWLRLNCSCPRRRSSPLPTPLSTPLVEVAPLALGFTHQ